jgi:hypothetical protein
MLRRLVAAAPAARRVLLHLVDPLNIGFIDISIPTMNLRAKERERK